MTRFKKPTYEELKYKHRFHFVSVLNTATKAQKNKTFPTASLHIMPRRRTGEVGYGSTLYFFLISVPDEVD